MEDFSRKKRASIVRPEGFARPIRKSTRVGNLGIRAIYGGHATKFSVWYWPIKLQEIYCLFIFWGYPFYGPNSAAPEKRNEMYR